MIIRTLTCHDVYNYGATLQAFALMKYLQLQGNDVEIIDYKPDYLNWKYRLSWYINEKSPYFSKGQTSFVFHCLYVLRRYIKEYKTIGRKLAFYRFNSKYLKLTKEYNSYAQLCKEPPEADTYIVGSDQVWNNNHLENGWDPTFYLNFGDASVKRISYAASFGSTTECPDIIKRWLRNLDAISIREESTLNLINNYYNNIGVVCDPVFLLDKEEWIKSLELEHKDRENYIAIYNLDDNGGIYEAASQIAKRQKWNIHVINTNAKKSGVKNICNADPKRFLTELLNARFVISDSFHATAFAIIFQKDFLTFPFKNVESSRRMIDLLKQFNLMSRFNPTNIRENFYNPIDYTEIKNSISAYKSYSCDWLLNNIK